MRLLFIALLVCLSGCAGKRLIKTDDIRPVNTPPVVTVDPEPKERGSGVFGKTAFADEFKPFSVTVYFDLESSGIRPDAAALIEDIATRAKGRTVAVYGACCPLGTVEYNQDLGLRRALAVRDAIGFGKIESWGETRLVTDDPAEFHLNRRAEVYVK